MNPDHTEAKFNQRRIWRQVAVTFFVACLLLVGVGASWFAVVSRPPADFPINSSITIEPGTNVSSIVEQFESESYVRSSELLYITLVTRYDATDVKAGQYVFSEPVTVHEVARIITEVGPQDELVRITIPEGVSVRTIAAIAESALSEFNPNSFISYATQDEGFLFPETYFVPKDFSDSDLYDLLRTTYDQNLAPLKEQIAAHPLSEAEIIVLASIIEREANSQSSMKLVSGILQNRLVIDMPLQADASVEYVLDKPLSELTPEDLRIDSPYNTYTNRGLPPTPIGNPGLIAIQAVLDPTPSDYLFYITGNDGIFYYGRNTPATQ